MSRSRPSSSEPPEGTRTIVTGGAIIAALGAGWFGLSHFVFETSTPDALGEALGVAFGLLVLASFVGAVVSSRGSHR
jgi:hypothetical protein